MLKDKIRLITVLSRLIHQRCPGVNGTGFPRGSAGLREYAGRRQKKRRLVDRRFDNGLLSDMLGQIRPQAARTRGMPQAADRFLFDLTDTFAGEIKAGANLFEG